MPPDQTPWAGSAILRPGQDVIIVNVSGGGALLHSEGRMKPGARAELQLSGVTRRAVKGRIDRCRVVALDPLCYEAAIVFDETFDWTKTE